MAAPPPPPPPTSLQDLHVDLLHNILERIPCGVDRGRMSMVCRAWRDAMREQRRLLGLLLPRPPPLPRLLLPAPFSVRLFACSARVACVLSACRVHHHLAVVPARSRFFGSHDDRWIFVETRLPRSNKAIHLRSGFVRGFPRELQRRTDPHVVHRMVIHAAALSSWPNDPNYIGAAIVTSWQHPPAVPPYHRCIALWRKGWPRAHDPVPLAHYDAALDAEDLLYNSVGRCFFFLTQGEHIRICTPVRLRDNELRTDWETIRFCPSGRVYDQYVRARYLVVSRGELLMVVRFTPQPNQPTSKFKVFRVAGRNTMVPDAYADAYPVALYPLEWSELHALDGRILFVGHGCSRSYEARWYPPGFTEGIYFLDDGEFYDAAVIFGNGNERCYPCSDNGKWSGGRVQRCFPRGDPSNRSAPVWLLP
ncbi:uncharacterized protein LOC120646188 [Panicum virgatum]|uniref:DUF295 domain-containing protein n=1 Tax=Panicum virgatum TaxID=38727 RepID=A0A8T0PJW1_PANVG|nr:uncharacterized protein LOC120646188 [Panicum virgatum]KAG2561178.1 hypothetical protein PVAP13_8KG147700 [Panicum virgatum]